MYVLGMMVSQIQEILGLFSHASPAAYTFTTVYFVHEKPQRRNKRKVQGVEK